VADVHVYVTRPPQKEGAALEDIEGVLRKLDYVSGVEASPTENVVAVSFEGGKAELGRSSAPSKRPALRSPGSRSGVPSLKKELSGISERGLRMVQSFRKPSYRHRVLHGIAPLPEHLHYCLMAPHL
jgi:hypothetical protein